MPDSKGPTKMKTAATLVIAASLLGGMLGLAPSPANPGVVFEIDVTDHEQSPPRIATTWAYVQGTNLKMTIAPRDSDAQDEAIFRGDRREMIVVDNDNQSYVVIDEAAIQALAAQLAAVKEQTQGLMAGMGGMQIPKAVLDQMPEEQRKELLARMEEAQKQMAAASGDAPGTEATGRGIKNEYRRTGDRATMAGYPSAKVEVFRGGRKTRELWVTDWSNLEGGGEVRGAFQSMADFFEELVGSIGDAMGDLGGLPGGGDSPFSDFAELGGFPVVTRDFGDDGSLEDEATLKSAKRQTIDPDAFEPPSGYKRQEMFRPDGGGGA